MIERHQKIKNSTVRILIDDKPYGTGFFINENGRVVTCMHVCYGIIKSDPITQQITSTIEMELADGTKYDCTIHNSINGAVFGNALYHDYLILDNNSGRNDFEYYEIESFNNIEEGSKIYLCGFPYGIGQPIVSTGYVSTKWTDKGYLTLQGMNYPDRNVAWLDITMNKGNSGGPVILKTDNIDNDRIIGIATFGLNPLAKSGEQLAQIANNAQGQANFFGIDIINFAKLAGNSISMNSVGIGGLVPIDYVQNQLNNI